jgi:hypothetical protein
LLAAGAALALGTGLAVGAATPASATTWGVSMYQACVEQHGQPSSVGVYAGWNVYGWRCRYNGGWNYIDQTINVSQYCSYHYGAVARYSNYNDPYSWYCYR